jgi:4-hydroxy-3-methylbut-2-enyl diphosphate reductase
MTADETMATAPDPGSLPPGTVLVADELVSRGNTLIRCPASVMLAGDLRRHGLHTIAGRLELRAAAVGSAPAVTAVLSIAGGPAGIGVATAADDPAGARTARTVLDAWAAVAGPRRILLASPRSFCAGVQRAIDIVERALALSGGEPVYVRRQIVHNVHVVADLEARGAVFVEELDVVPAGATVVLSAHGVSPAVRAEGTRRGLRVVDATCPLVNKVHSEGRRFAARGDTVILIGHEGHEEVEGTIGEAPNQMVVVGSADEVGSVRVPDSARVSYLTQTTLAVEETTEVIEALKRRFPALRGPATDDICYATTNRQRALNEIVGASDLVLVVGSENSSNSRRLVELAHRYATPAHLIDGPDEIRAEWLAGVHVVGLTAGASAPPFLVDEVIAALGGLGPVTVTEHEAVREDVSFELPPEVRPA